MHRAARFLVPAVVACAGDSAIAPPDTRLLVVGNDMGPRIQNVTLTRGATTVSNALVTVNGTVLTELDAGHYTGTLPVTLAAGDTVRLEVIAGADSVTGIALVPTLPSLLVPGNGTVIHVPTPLSFTWVDGSDPDEFRAAITFPGAAEVASYPGSARSGAVVTSRLPPTATNLTAYVYAYNDGNFTGPANPGSRMSVRQSGGTVSLVLGQ